ncbi:MAG: carbohydrate-binding protein, partial [Anaerolineales bacterium]
MKRFIYITLVLCVLFSLMLTASVSAAPARADRGAWAPGVAYAVNDTVTYGGCSYKVLQAHTSQTGWEPPNVPALFTQLSCGTVAPTNTPTITRTNTPSGPTATFTKTNTPGAATNTPTKTPIPPTATITPTTGSGGVCGTAWNSATAYTTGMIASDAGHNYKANWWNQNDRPSTSTTGAWTDQGACPTGPTATPRRPPPPRPRPPPPPP